MNAKAAFQSLRIRATPLVLSGVAMAVSVAVHENAINWASALFLMLTAVFLQFVSNLSNTLGDSLKGTDRADREGKVYALQSGELQIGDFKILIGVCIALSCIFGLLMIYFSFGTLFSPHAIGFILLGVLAIIAAMRYTLGKNPYGYRGLGDIYVFLFFGLAVVSGGYFLCCNDPQIWSSVLPACAIGCFSVGVLNVNNIRDMKADAATRVTMAIRMGEKGSRVYQTVLIVLGWVLMLTWSAAFREDVTVWSFAYVLTLPLFIKHLVTVWKHSGSGLDAMVPLLSISTFLFSLMTLLG